MHAPSSSPGAPSEEQARTLVRAAINHFLMRYRGGLLAEPSGSLFDYYAAAREPDVEVHARFLAWVRRAVLWSPVRVVEVSPVQEVSGVPCRDLPCGAPTVRFAFGPLTPPAVAIFLRGVRFVGAGGESPLAPMEPEAGDGIFVLPNGRDPVFVLATRDPVPGRGWPRWLLPLFWPAPGSLFALERSYERVRAVYPWPGKPRELAFVTAQVASVYRSVRERMSGRLGELRADDGASLVLL